MYYELLNGYCYYHRFDSLSDMTDYVQSIWHKYAPMKHKPIHDADFLGRSFTNINEVITACHQYWDEGMETYERMIKRIGEHHLQAPISIKRKPTWSEDDGDELCLDRLRYSQPYWRTTRRDHRPGPVNVTILSDIGTPSEVNHRDVLWRGVASVCLTKLLESAGYRIELLIGQYLSNRTYQSGKHLLDIMSLKKCEEAIDESTLINAVSSWAFRTIYFASTYHDGEIKYPHQTGAAENLSPWLSVITPDPQVITCQNVWTEHAAVNWIKQQLEKFASGEFAVQP